MSIYCRLCAGLKTEDEMASEICDLRLMLNKCCQWQKSENECHLPQHVCYICMEQLDNCWEFLLQIECAEKKLNEMLTDQKVEVKEDIAFVEFKPHIEDIKEDIQEIKDDENSSNYVQAECLSAIEQNENNNDDNDDENDNNDNNNDNNNSSNDSEQEVIKGARSRPLRKPFKSILEENDYLASGLISIEGVEKLMTELPDMKTLNWNNCKYKCIKCDDRNINGINQYISHCKSVHFEQYKKMKFFCYYCNEKLRNFRLLNSHIAEQHYIHLKYQCLYCDDVYWNVNELKRHRQLHVIESFYCELCNKGPMKKSNFMSHLTTKHRKKDEIKSNSYTCDICKNVFATMSSVKLHILNKHAKIKNEICDQCGWCFAQKGNLLAHIRSVHSNIRPFQCTFCHKDFKTKTHLKNHIRIHSSTKSHHCKHCTKSFITKSQLTAHNKTHALVGEFTCSYCAKNFKQRTTWKTHERIHTNDLRYICPHSSCEYKSTIWGNLNKHTTKQHGIDLRSERWKNGPFIADKN